MKKRILAVCVIAVSGAASAALINGDFEATPFDTGWSTTATNTTGFAPGSSTAVEILDANFFQDTTSGFSEGTVSWWVQTETFTAGSRSFNMVIGTSAGDNFANLRLNSADGTTATLQTHDGGFADASAFSFAENSIYYFQMDFTGLGTGDKADCSYELKWSNANPGSATTANTSGSLQRFQNDGHVQTLGATLDRLSFNGNASYDKVNIDDVSVIPEPATLGLVAALGGAILFIRRRFMI